MTRQSDTLTPTAEIVDGTPAGSDQIDATLRPRTPLEQLLPDVLAAMGWRRTDAVFASALPADKGLDGLDTAAFLLALLDLSATVESGLPQNWHEGLDGAVLVLTDTAAHAIVRVNGTENVFSTTGADAAQVPEALHQAQRLLFIRNLSAEEQGTLIRQTLRRRVKRGLRHGLFLSFFINAAAALIPLFSMAVFDRVLGAGAPHSLPALISGAAVVVLCVFLLRRARSRFLAAEYARLSSIAGLVAELRLLRAPFMVLQRQSVDRIDARIAAVRRSMDFFSASNVPAVFDAPFILISILLIGFFGGILAIVPVVYLCLFVAIAALLAKGSSDASPETVIASRKRAAMLHELGTNATELRESGVAGAWLKSFADASKLTALGSHSYAIRQSAIQSIGAILSTGAALVTLAVGVELALKGVITSGALVGTMMLTWRVTGPARGFFLGLPRLNAARRALGSLEQNVTMPTVTRPAVAMERMPAVAPAVECVGAYLRFTADDDAAIAGVSFKAEPGSTTAIIGPNGSGKTTLLRLLSGALTPQGGQVLLGGVNLRRYDPDELAIMTEILPPLSPRVYGSDKFDAAKDWQASSIVRSVIDQALGDHGTTAPGAPSAPILGATTPVYALLDDPTACASDEERAAFIQYLDRTRDTATVLFSTHDPSLVRLADNVLVLSHGAILYFGPVEKDDQPVATLER